MRELILNRSDRIVRYGLRGAAYATLLPPVLVFISFYLLVSRHHFRMNIGKNLPKLVAAPFGMGLLAHLARGLNLIVVIGMGVVAYCLILCALKAFDEFDRMLLRRTLSALW